MEEKSLCESNSLKSYTDLAKALGREHCGFTDTDEKYIDMFWEQAFNKSWLYLSEDVVVDWLGYKRAKDTMRNFYRNLTGAFEEGLDYREVDQSDEMVQKSRSSLKTSEIVMVHNKKHYIVSGETFKALALSARTERGKEVRKYYIKVESLAALVSQEIYRQVLEEKISLETKASSLIQEKASIEARNLELEAAHIRLHNENKALLTYKKVTSRDQSIYICTTYDYARQGLYKIGRSKVIKKRNHNTDHPHGDRVFLIHESKVNDCALVENVIHRKLAGLRSTHDAEFFLIPRNEAVRVVSTICHNDGIVNEEVDRAVERVNYLNTTAAFRAEDWFEPADFEVPAPPKLISPSEDWTDEQKMAYILEAIDAVRAVDERLLWTDIRDYLINALQVPRARFRSSEWAAVAKREPQLRKSIVFRLAKKLEPAP